MYGMSWSDECFLGCWHTLSARKTRQIGHGCQGLLNLLLFFPELFYLCRPASTARRKHLPRMKTGSRSHLKKYPVTILDFLAVLHRYRWRLEADFLYTSFLPARACHNFEFLLNFILLFCLLTHLTVPNQIDAAVMISLLNHTHLFIKLMNLFNKFWIK